MVSGAGDAIATHMCFRRCISLLEKIAMSIQNGVNSFVSAIPFAAVVRYRFSNSGCDSTDMSSCDSAVTVMKHWLFGGIV